MRMCSDYGISNDRIKLKEFTGGQISRSLTDSHAIKVSEFIHTLHGHARTTVQFRYIVVVIVDVTALLRRLATEC